MELIVMAVMIGLNSLFAAYEIALASIGEGRLHALVEGGRRGAASALRMKQNIEGSLAVVQLGITLVGAIAAATGGAGASESLEPVLRDRGVSAGVSQLLAVGIVVAPLTVVTIVVGELVPKVFALRNKERVCLVMSPAMEWFTWSVWPAVWFLEKSVGWIMAWGTRSGVAGAKESEGEAAIEELHGAAALARVTRLIGEREEGIIISASRLATTTIRRIMLPTEFIDMLVADQTLLDALVAAHQGMHTRYPVTEEAGNPQRIIGYVNFKDIVATLRTSPHNPSFRNLIRELPKFDAEMSVADCLEHLMRDRNHIGLVREGNSTTIGMVTLEDIIEELVGEIHDEMDRMPSHLIRAGDGWIAGGFVSLTQLTVTTGMKLKPVGDKPMYTLSDWIVEQLGHPPHGGDTLQVDGIHVAIRKTRSLLVQEAYLEQLQQVDAPAAGDKDAIEREERSSIPPEKT